MNPKTKIQFKRDQIVLILAWMVVQAICLLKMGIVVKGEAAKYISEAAFFASEGHFSQPKYLFYSFYIFIQVAFNQSGLGIVGIYVFQLLLNLGSLWLFYKTVAWHFEDEKPAFLSSFLLIICFPWQLWTTHLYTESVFLSLVLIFTCLFLKPNKSISEYLLTIVLFGLLLFTRPTGILFIPLILLWYILKWIQGKKWITLLTGTAFSVSGFIFLVNYAMKGQGEFDFLKPFVEEHIICGVPQITNNRLMLPEDGNSLQGLLYYVFHNPVHFIKLSTQKLGAFFGMTRTYYSSPHNLALVIFFYPLYVLAMIGFISWRKKKREIVTFISGGICIFALSVILSCDDWLNRFIMPVLPFIILLAGAGITTVASFMRKKVV